MVPCLKGLEKRKITVEGKDFYLNPEKMAALESGSKLQRTSILYSVDIEGSSSHLRPFKYGVTNNKLTIHSFNKPLNNRHW